VRVINQINLVVEDFDRSVAFYRRLGAGFRPTDTAVHAQAEYPGMSLELDDEHSARWWHAAWRARPEPRAVITVRVDGRDEVDDLYAELTAAGAEGRQPPFDAFFGARYAIVADPGGNDVALMSEPDESRRVWPPDAESPAP
jgi:uncharacterized glyoxalase superfamily protein PhnB